MRTGFGPTLRTGLEHALAARFDDLTARSQHARLDLFASQRAFDEPGAPLDEGNAAPIIGQSLDNQALLLADRHLGLALAAARLKAQSAATFGHQLKPALLCSLKMSWPTQCGAWERAGDARVNWVRHTRRSTDSGRRGRSEEHTSELQ